MIIDIKYHIASLAAVFLALATGILIGMTMLGNDAIVEQQEKLTTRLETDLNLMREEAKVADSTIKNYEQTVGTYKEFSNEALPVLITGKLEGKQIAVIETNAHTFSDELLNNFTVSGAKVTSMTSIKNPMSFNAEQKQQVLQQLGLSDNVSPDDLKEIIATEVSKGIETGENFDFLTFLEDLELINLSGEYGVPVNFVVIIGGSQDKAALEVNNIDIPIIKQLKATGVEIFGVEKTNTGISYMEEYQKQKISTVDNVDTVIGQVALIWAMAGNPGDYGVKETAKAILPQGQKVAQ